MRPAAPHELSIEDTLVETWASTAFLALLHDTSAEVGVAPPPPPGLLDRLTRNLLRALKDEAILHVLDNFETNLKTHAEPRSGVRPGADPTIPLAFCEDPAWDHCLTSLARELTGSPSRILITCRRPLAALPEQSCHQFRSVRCRRRRPHCIWDNTLA
jgi:hypothetical protein